MITRCRGQAWSKAGQVFSGELYRDEVGGVESVFIPVKLSTSPPVNHGSGVASEGAEICSLYNAHLYGTNSVLRNSVKS